MSETAIVEQDQQVALSGEKPLTKKELARYQEREFRARAPELIKKTLESLLQRVASGDMQAIQLATKMLKMVDASPMVSINTQVNTQVNANGRSGRANGFEDIIRRQEERESRARHEGTVIDATPL